MHVRSYDPVMNLSPDLLKAQFVKGKLWALSICYFVSDTSEQKGDAERCIRALGRNVLHTEELPNIPDTGKTFHGPRGYVWILAQHQTAIILPPCTTEKKGNKQRTRGRVQAVPLPFDSSISSNTHYLVQTHSESVVLLIVGYCRYTTSTTVL